MFAAVLMVLFLLPQAARSRQGKMEKSFLSFAATYPTWEPDSAAKQMLLALGHAPSLRGAVPQGPADTDYIQSAIAASLFPGAPRCEKRADLVVIKALCGHAQSKFLSV